MNEVVVLDKRHSALTSPPPYLLWKGDVAESLQFAADNDVRFDLVITSPPYNIGKEYEDVIDTESYVSSQDRVISKIATLLSPTGSVCWQVGNFVTNGEILPIDILLHPIFARLGFKLRNRIIWRFGHGLHCKQRFSGRYEVIMWYSATDDYVFNLDAVRIPSKYPGKKAFKGLRAGQYSGNPLGKNPEDVWDIPNVKSGHIEKTIHPCQFPVGLVERLVLALTNHQDLVFDPFAGVGSAGVAAAIHGRRFWGAEIAPNYIKIAEKRINDALGGKALHRPHDKPIYDHSKSKLSRKPDVK